MRMRYFIYPLMQITLLSLAASNAQANEPVYIAGTNPAERPATAPVITEVQHDSAWYTASLRGVEQPYPASLHFLENQGNWFTPFTHPGMTDYYDIRGWHTGE
ncbi:hypothetical protein [Thiothrix nivea]|uniref:Uncharacterized protein n=1 Tax=Thiothrix nivea (strain ATCC 35100 / DSM 5205 / JP2) TaxID=870187 RepID=A0A656HJS0_THINJ|nr:hypothetical protein [Thiothrix nivea]EIJ36717.1 hypothetical protein Thini_4230 [Thiothrix nivea DSM 5205]